jgi:hypothetical protein
MIASHNRYSVEQALLAMKENNIYDNTLIIIIPYSFVHLLIYGYNYSLFIYSGYDCLSQ